MTCAVCLLDIAGRIVILLKQLETLDTGHWTPGLIHQSVLEAYLLYNSAMPGQVDVAMLVSIYCSNLQNVSRLQVSDLYLHDP